MEQLTGTLSGAPNSNDYEKMNHKPQINGVELVGNKTSEELGMGGDYATREELEEGLKGKVDAEEGKGLSSHDFSSEEKEKLEGIEDGAQKNVPVPTKVSELENDSGYQTKEQVEGRFKTVEEEVSGLRGDVAELEKRLDGLVDGNEVEF